MAGSITVTTSVLSRSGGVTKYSVAWTSDAAGAVSGTTFAMNPGTIILVDFVPGSGAAQPTDLYDVTMLDEHSVNVFDDGAGTSVGANLSNVNSTHKIPFVGGGSVTYVRHWLHGGDYQPVVAAAGNAKQGTIDIYVLPGLA